MSRVKEPAPAAARVLRASRHFSTSARARALCLVAQFAGSRARLRLCEGFDRNSTAYLYSLVFNLQFSEPNGILLRVEFNSSYVTPQ